MIDWLIDWITNTTTTTATTTTNLLTDELIYRRYAIVKPPTWLATWHGGEA